MLIEQALERCARFGMKPGLDSIRATCAAMGNPQDALRVVHVAGTNGKGAVCTLIDAALREAGFGTGRYTSPHLVSLAERFIVNGEPAPSALIDEAFSAVPDSGGLTYFELLTATAFELYRRANVDYLVLETGLGGRLDATNVVRRPELCVITRIGLDHCDWLGGTIPEIAAEKGGIIKPGVPVVLGAMPQEARDTLERIAAERGAPCVYAPAEGGELSRAFCAVESGEMRVEKPSTHNTQLPTLNLKGAFNRENAVTAAAALELLGVPRDAVERGFAAARWPGRYQRIERGGKTFLVDGAHNPPAMRALVDSLKMEDVPFRTAICGFCGDKDVAANLRTLAEVVRSGIAVAIRNPRSLAAERTADLMRSAGIEDVRACASLHDALESAPSGTVVCGSLFLAGEALQELGEIPESVRFTPSEKVEGLKSLTQRSRGGF